MRYFLYILIIIPSKLFAQNPDEYTLSYKQFTTIVKTHHPLAKIANLQVKYGNARLQKSRGLFDPKLYSNIEQKQFNGKQYYNLTNSGLKIPTWFGIDFFGGYTQNDGIYLNPQNITQTEGLWNAGVSIPIGKGLFIDKRRAELKKAKLFVESTSVQQQLLLNELIFQAGKIYWEWFISYNNLLIFDEAVNLAKQRFEAIKLEVSLGERPTIDTVEANIQLQNRKLNYEQSLLDFRNNAAKLSVYLWKDGIIPMEITDKTVPNKANEIKTISYTQKLYNNIDSLQQKHPEIVSYNYKIIELKIEKRLKQELIKPSLNLKYNALAAPLNNDPFTAYNTNNYKWGVEFSIPIFLRKERGELKIANLKLQEKKLAIENKIVAINYKIKVATNQLSSTSKQANIFKKAVLEYEKLLIGEKQMFEAGESSLFMINSREKGYIDAQLKYIELLAKNQKAKLETDYSLGLLNN